MTWDGVRWQEILNGVDRRLDRKLDSLQFVTDTPDDLVPHLRQIASNGGTLLGADDSVIAASSPSTVSLPGYTEILSGRTPACANNDCGPTKVETLLDAWHAARPGARLAAIASWGKIAHALGRDLSSFDVSTGRLRVSNKAAFCATSELCEALEEGKRASPWPGDGDYRPDRATARVALSYLRTHRPNFAFISLGDTDEHAHHNDYARYLSALHQADETLGAVHGWLQEQARNGTRTLLIVTTDHGRSNGFAQHTNCPEAARVWALVAGSGVTAREGSLTPRRRLADIAPTVRDFVGLPRDASAIAGTSLVGFRAAFPDLVSAGVVLHPTPRDIYPSSNRTLSAR